MAVILRYNIEKEKQVWRGYLSVGYFLIDEDFSKISDNTCC
jgi:hypothetical protein